VSRQRSSTAAGEACADGPSPSLAAWRRYLTAELAAAGTATPDLDARLLVSHCCGLGPVDMMAHPERPVAERDAIALRQALTRRKAGEPVSRIVGHRQFWGRDFLISPATLDPRPETETVVELALAMIDAEGWRAGRNGQGLRILDIGTGTGCLLLSLLAEIPGACGLGTDISERALGIATKNAILHGLSDRCAWVLADYLQGIGGPFDVIVANPPYIPCAAIDGLEREVVGYDPRGALDGGPDGLAAYRLICSSLGQVLPDGWLVFEVGQGQATSVANLLRVPCAISHGHRSSVNVRFANDLGGVVRCVAARTRKLR